MPDSCPSLASSSSAIPCLEPDSIEASATPAEISLSSSTSTSKTSVSDRPISASFLLATRSQVPSKCHHEPPAEHATSSPTMIASTALSPAASWIQDDAPANEVQHDAGHESHEEPAAQPKAHFTTTQSQVLPRDRREDKADWREKDASIQVDAASSFISLRSSPTLGPTLLSTPAPSSPAASNPASGLPSPPPEATRDDAFVPPLRSKSTPYRKRHKSSRFHHEQFECDSADGSKGTSTTSLIDSNYEDEDADPEDETFDKSPSTIPFSLLPTEVHEAILDHIFGYRVSSTSGSDMSIHCFTKRWGSLRHSRRKELTELALVSPLWRSLIQQRLYRHIKLKATIDVLQDAMVHFAECSHLQEYVKHVEVWFSVFQPTYGPLALSNTLMLPVVTSDGLTNTTYTLPGNNCTLEEVFRFVSTTTPQIQALTLEGGERRKAPRVVYFHRPGRRIEDTETESDTDAERQALDEIIDGEIAKQNEGSVDFETNTEDGSDFDVSADRLPLPCLPSVRTLITRGQWNLMRETADFQTVLEALPGLKEWQASYSKPKSKSYITMSNFLPLLPGHITNLNLCLESDYRREAAIPTFYAKVVRRRTHICSPLAETLEGLEHFAYTGRVCHRFFDVASKLVDPRTSRLRSIDVTVKNCCRPLGSIQDSGSGIQDMAFIDAFERLVLSAVNALDKFKQLEYLRIRFVDLDSVLPPLNPFFVLRNDACSGVWSGGIIDAMARVRPEVVFPELSDTFGNIVYNKDGRMVIAPEHSRRRVMSLKLSNYRSLMTRITIQ